MSINRDYSQDKPPDKLYLQWYVDPDSYMDPDEIAPPGDPIVAHPEDRTYSENEPVYEHDVLYVRANPWIDVNGRLPDHSGAVLVYFIGDYALGYWSPDDEEWTIEGNVLGFDPAHYLTHWCELPKPPGA